MGGCNGGLQKFALTWRNPVVGTVSMALFDPPESDVTPSVTVERQRWLQNGTKETDTCTGGHGRHERSHSVRFEQGPLLAVHHVLWCSCSRPCVEQYCTMGTKSAIQHLRHWLDHRSMMESTTTTKRCCRACALSGRTHVARSDSQGGAFQRQRTCSRRTLAVIVETSIVAIDMRFPTARYPRSDGPAGGCATLTLALAVHDSVRRARDGVKTNWRK